MATPDATQIREWSQVDFAGRGFAEATPDPLQVKVDEGIAYLSQVTGRTFDPPPPDVVLPVLNAALRMRVEQLVMQSQDDVVETAGDFDLIGSFSAGSYSETRREIGETTRVLNPWPALEEMLWLLMTSTPAEVAAGGNAAVDERLDYWRWVLGLGTVAPSWAMVEVNWAGGLGSTPVFDLPFDRSY
jgi:hypothetical protein